MATAGIAQARRVSSAVSHRVTRSPPLAWTAWLRLELKPLPQVTLMP